METPPSRETAEKPDRVQELVALAERPPHDPEKLELFLRVRTILAKVRPELDGVFHSLFEKGHHERDARTFLGRIREVLSGKKLTREEFDLLTEASSVPGFSLIHTYIGDTTFPEEKPPVTERVIREIPALPASSTGSTPIRCGNEAILERRV